MLAVPFRYAKHLVTVPVVVGQKETRFALNTGAGVTFLSKSLAERVDCLPSGSSFTGRRMAGQQVTAPLGPVSSLSLGDYRRDDLTVGIFGIGAAADLEGIEGFLALDFFRSTPVTFDYPAGVIVPEDANWLAARAEAGIAVDVRLTLDDCIVEVFLPIEIPGRGAISVEVDSGSDSLILNEALVSQAGIDLAAENTRRVKGQYETGHAYTRYFAKLSGDVSVTGAPTIRQSDPQVMVQKIIHDGLVGDAFPRNFVVSYGLPRSRMIFATTCSSWVRGRPRPGASSSKPDTPVSWKRRRQGSTVGMEQWSCSAIVELAMTSAAWSTIWARRTWPCGRVRLRVRRSRPSGGRRREGGRGEAHPRDGEIPTAEVGGRQSVGAEGG